MRRALEPQRWRQAVRRLKFEADVRRDLRTPLPSSYAACGEGTVVVPPARVNNPQHIWLGEGVVIHEQAWLAVYAKHPGVTPRLEIGDRTRIGRFAHIACIGEVVFEEDVLTADMIFVADTHHGYEDGTSPIADQPLGPPAPVRIGRGSFLGIRATVLQGVTIGEHAYVAAGAVVTCDVDPYTVVVGNPARPVRRYDKDLGEWVRVP